MVRPAFSMFCLLWAATVASADTWPLNHRSMQIPIRIEPSRRAEIKELQLLYSTDEGRNWSQGGAATPEKEAFAFTAPADGVYWFGLIIVKNDGTREPPSAFNLTPSMKVQVDTTKPVARIVSAERQGDEVALRWEVQDASPDWGSFKLEQRATDSASSPWVPIPAKGSANGQTRFRPLHGGSLLVRLMVKDLAGNETVAVKEVAGGTPGTHTHGTGASTPVPPPEPPMLITTVGAPPRTVTEGGTAGNVAAANPGGPITPPPPTLPRPPVVSSPREASPPQESVGSGVTQTNVRVPVPSAMDRGLIPPTTTPHTPENGNRVVAATTDVQAPPLPLPGGVGERTAPPQSPGVLLSNSLQVTLDYEVNKVGPSGIGSVELWLTRNQGTTWEKYAEDADLKPPMIVDLPGEGVFGLTLVVRSRAGMGRRPPRDGERPQMLVEVDVTAPEAKLYAPQPVRGQRDQLQILWEASDKNLAPTGITLEWSERQGGPWQPIAADLPNTGRHSWKLPANMPYRVYMRLLVRDTAGNVSVAETRDPVLIDLSEPEGVITIIRPAGLGSRQ